MEYIYTDPETRRHIFRWPAAGCHLRAAAGQRRKKADLRCGMELWVNPMDDLRELGFILRGSDQWVAMYSKRMTIEHTFRSLKHSRNLEAHPYWNMEKVTLHAMLSILTCQATMLARCRTGDFGNLRQTMMKVG